MELNIREKGPIRIVEVEGHLDLYDTPKLKAEMQNLLDEGHTRIVMNLGGVNFIDSSGLGALMSIREDLVGAGGNLVISNLSPLAADLVRNNLGEVVAIFDAEAEALTFFDD